MPHHLHTFGLMEWAAQMIIWMGKRNSNRAAPSQRGWRGSRGACQAGPGITFSSGSKAQIITQRSHWDMALHTPNADPEPMQLIPKGAVVGGLCTSTLSKYKHIKQAHAHRTS